MRTILKTKHNHSNREGLPFAALAPAPHVKRYTNPQGRVA